MSSYIDQNLMNGERVVYRAKLHWIIFKWAILWLLLGLLLMAGRASGGAVLCVFVAIALGIVEYLNFSGSEFGLTNKRVIIKVGVLRRQSLETLLNKIEGVSVDQGILGRILGFGTITVNGTGSTKTPFPKIALPLDFRRQVQEQIEASVNKPVVAAVA